LDAVGAVYSTQPGSQFVGQDEICDTALGLTCDHVEELFYLHEVWPKVREWQAIKKARLV